MNISLTTWKRTIFKIRYSLNSQNSVWKPNNFPRQAIPTILFSSHSDHIGDAQYRVRIDLNNSLTTWKRTIFKFRYSLNSQNSVWKPNFFPWQAMPKILFALHSHYIGDTPYRVWIDLKFPWPHERNFFKNRHWLKSQSFVWKLNFFPRETKPKIFFTLHFHYICDTPYRFWIDLTNSLTTSIRTIFKFLYSLSSQNSYENPTFFLGKLCQQLLCLTLWLHWWCFIPSSYWLEQLLDNMKKNYVLISLFAKFAKFRMKNQLFSLASYAENTFCFTLSLHWWYSIPNLDWFE